MRAQRLLPDGGIDGEVDGMFWAQVAADKVASGSGEGDGGDYSAFHPLYLLPVAHEPLHRKARTVQHRSTLSSSTMTTMMDLALMTVETVLILAIPVWKRKTFCLRLKVNSSELDPNLLITPEGPRG